MMDNSGPRTMGSLQQRRQNEGNPNGKPVALSLFNGFPDTSAGEPRGNLGTRRLPTPVGRLLKRKM